MFDDDPLAKYLLPIVYHERGMRVDFAVLLLKYMAIVKDHEGVNLTQYNHPIPLSEDEAAVLDMIDEQARKFV